MEIIWQKAGDHLREKLGQVCYETWIGPLNFKGVAGKTAMLEAPNKFFRDWVNERYLDHVRQALCAESGDTLEVNLTFANGNGNGNGNGRHKEAAESLRTPPPSRQPVNEPSATRTAPQFNPRYTFAEFVVGSGNQFAHAAAQAVAHQPGEKYNPLFIYGGVGLGKTHLVTAIGHHLIASGERPRKVLFMPAEVFMNELISSLRRDQMS